MRTAGSRRRAGVGRFIGKKTAGTSDLAPGSPPALKGLFDQTCLLEQALNPDLLFFDEHSKLVGRHGGIHPNAALYPETVANIVLAVAPIDFHADAVENRQGHGFISLWTRSMSGEDVDRLIEANGNLPGELMSFVFSMMTPLASLTKYNVGLYDVMDEEKKLLNFLRMEKWLQDRPHHPGEAAKQWLKDLYQENRLVKGTFELGGRTVDLENMSMPVLNIFAPTTTSFRRRPRRRWRSSSAPKRYSELALPGGHVGVFVSGKSQGSSAQGIVDWLRKRS